MNQDKYFDDLNKRLGQFLGAQPRIDASAWIAPEATVIGDVRIGPQASVWSGSVLRGDINFIEIGEGTNVQDGAVIHLADDYPVRIGNYCTVGHLAMIHACEIGNECLIGMHATILDGAVIGDHCIIGAQALVPQGMLVPSGSMVLGVPGKVVKTLDEEAKGAIRGYAEKYIHVAKAHRAAGKQGK